MNEIFNHVYSSIYDGLYSEKDTEGEVNCLKSILSKHTALGSIGLDLGCGTGRHSIKLSDFVNMVCVDQSLEMLKKIPNKPNLTVHHCDIAKFNASRQFDFAISLFHVLSYMKSSDLINSFFACLQSSVRKGGLIIFDGWLASGFFDRFCSEGTKSGVDLLGQQFVRKTNSICLADRDCVEVHINLDVDTISGQTIRSSEIHHLRYFTLNEVKLLLGEYGFSLVEARTNLFKEVIDQSSSEFLIVAKKV